MLGRKGRKDFRYDLPKQETRLEDILDEIDYGGETEDTTERSEHEEHEEQQPAAEPETSDEEPPRKIQKTFDVPKPEEEKRKDRIQKLTVCP